MTAQDSNPTLSPVIRLLAANLPEAFAQTLERIIAGQLDIEYMGRVDGQMEVLIAAAAGIDVLILGAEQVQPMPGICSHLFYEYPLLKIVVIAGSEAGIYWLGLRYQPLSRVPMLDMIRQAYRLDPI